MKEVTWPILKERNIRQICKTLYFYLPINNLIISTNYWSIRCSILSVFDVDFRARRAAKEAKDAPAQPAPEKARVDVKKFVKIGRPGYKVTKQRDPDTAQQSLLFQVRFVLVELRIHVTMTCLSLPN